MMPLDWRQQAIGKNMPIAKRLEALRGDNRAGKAAGHEDILA
jgi:hypothetical protein